MHQSPRRQFASAGDDAIAWAESIGWDDEEGHGFYELDEWQKFCIRGILAEDEMAALCALVCLLLVPRQNGKNVVLEVIELYALFVLDLRYILHSAHLTETSADHMARLWEAIQSDDDLSRQCRQSTAHGFEKILRKADKKASPPRHASIIRFRTRSKKVGRGGSPQMGVFDEALYLDDRQIAALLPSLSAQTMKGDPPILIYASSAPVAESQVLHRLRTAILAGKMPDAFMAEWSIELPDAGDDRHRALLALVADPENLYISNPGMGERISPDWCRDIEQPTMGLEEWCIERLGVVFEADGTEGVLPSTKWAVCADGSSHCDEGRASLSVGPNGAWAAFGFAGTRADGSLHLEVTRHAPGTDWVVDHAVKVVARRGPLVVDPRTPTSGLLARLVKADVELQEVSTPEWVQACAALQADVNDCSVRHLSQPELNAAVAGVTIRTMGEAWAFTAKASTVDITPLQAVTLAAFGARAGEDKSARSTYEDNEMRVIG